VSLDEPGFTPLDLTDPHQHRGWRDPEVAASDRRHLIITGTGRAGTTLLVQYLTVLGFDTGVDPKRAVRGVDNIAHAGLEQRALPASGRPYVLKAPAFSYSLGRQLAENDVVIDAAIVPIRDLFAAAESRRRVGRELVLQGRSPAKGAGGLTGTEDPTQQETVLAAQFHQLIETLVRHAIPIWFLPFPAFARDHETLWSRLGPLLATYAVTPAESARAFATVVRPEWIHDFTPDAEPRPGIDYTPVD
jgi:hypothetical protein